MPFTIVCGHMVGLKVKMEGLSLWTMAFSIPPFLPLMEPVLSSHNLSPSLPSPASSPSKVSSSVTSHSYHRRTVEPLSLCCLSPPRSVFWLTGSIWPPMPQSAPLTASVSAASLPSVLCSPHICSSVILSRSNYSVDFYSHFTTRLLLWHFDPEWVTLPPA